MIILLVFAIIFVVGLVWFVAASAASAAGVGWRADAAAGGPTVTGAFRFMGRGGAGSYEFSGAPAVLGVGDGRVALPALVSISLTRAECAVVLEGLAAHEDHYSQAPDAVQPSAVAVLIERQLRGMG